MSLCIFDGRLDDVRVCAASWLALASDACVGRGLINTGVPHIYTQVYGALNFLGGVKWRINHEVRAPIPSILHLLPSRTDERTNPASLIYIISPRTNRTGPPIIAGA